MEQNNNRTKKANKQIININMSYIHLLSIQHFPEWCFCTLTKIQLINLTSQSRGEETEENVKNLGKIYYK